MEELMTLNIFAISPVVNLIGIVLFFAVLALPLYYVGEPWQAPSDACRRTRTCRPRRSRKSPLPRRRNRLDQPWQIGRGARRTMASGQLPHVPFDASRRCHRAACRHIASAAGRCAMEEPYSGRTSEEQIHG